MDRFERSSGGRIAVVLAAAYLLLLGASHLLRWQERKTRDSAESAGLDRTDSRPTIWLLHGSPGSGRDFAGLESHLEEHYDVRAPDLPGFGRNHRVANGYSIRAQAEYVDELLDAAGPDPVHIVGLSLGGGAALELAHRSPDRLESLTLLSSIGPQEYELLGSYPINHAVHALQLVGITALLEGVPHFGLLDRQPFNYAYARSFYDTDQRPLREYARWLRLPVLILHGRHDPLVPLAAAEENHRLVAQSELVVFESDHFMVFRDPETVAAELLHFIGRVERGEAIDRAEAAPARVVAAARPFESATVPPASGITLWVSILLIAAATLVSEDLTTISAGLLVAQGRIGFGAAVAACFLGILVGDVLLFWAGRVLGRPWLRRRPLSWILSEAQIGSASDWLRRRGGIVILLSRFLPGMRLPTYFAAGVLQTSFLRFVAYFALAVALWTPLLVWTSVAFGTAAFDRLADSNLSSTKTFLLLAGGVWLALGLTRSLASPSSRRRWRFRLISMGRWSRWEFWPPWLFYPPVVAWIVWLGVRHGSPTLFTAANPGMPAGGFVGESKSDILDHLPANDVARYLRLPASLDRATRRRQIERFLVDRRLQLPIVLKPDVGQRGAGVAITRSWADVDEHLAAWPNDLIVQEFIAGPELGVFYIRFPNEPTGRIFSITQKRLPSVVGDGRSTLEELVLSTSQTRPRARQLLDGRLNDPHQVPEHGEQVALVDIGTHSRGAIFEDGEKFRTAALEAAVDRISQSYRGFHFGRYDLRAPSVAALREGRALKVLELNGVTSEATHIYDRRNKLFAAYGTLFEQWRLAFELGAAQRDLGVEPTALLGLASLAWSSARAVGPSTSGRYGDRPAETELDR